MGRKSKKDRKSKRKSRKRKTKSGDQKHRYTVTTAGTTHNHNNTQHDEEVDFETLVKEEFKKLHRQYRLMEDARHAIAGASGVLTKQGHLLERLRAEKENLLADIRNAKSEGNRLKDKQTIKTILEALERYEKYKADITTCLVNIAEMEANVDRITQRLVEQKLKVQAMYGQSMTVPQADKRKRVLENRLYHVTTQFDTLISNNKDLKHEINMMLKLRTQFYNRMWAIKRISARIKHRMAEVVYEATNAYDQRDEWVTKINLLRERNDKDSKQHVLEIKEFQRVLHHDSKMNDFLAVKNREREVIETNKQRVDRKIKVKVTDLNALLQAYKKAFKSIYQRAKSKDIESLVTVYQEEEQKNYAMFKNITDLNHEMNSLRDGIATLKKEIEDMSAARKAKKQNRKAIISELKQKLAKETKHLKETLEEWNAKDAEVEAFGKILSEAFSKTKSSSRFIVTFLGNLSGMKPHNLGLCLKALEHRVTELLYEKASLEIRKHVELEQSAPPKKHMLWQPGFKPPPQGGPFKPQIHITGRMDSEQDEEEESRAWSMRPIYYFEMKDGLGVKLNNAVGEMEKHVSIDVDNLMDPSELLEVSADHLSEHKTSYGGLPPSPGRTSSAISHSRSPTPSHHDISLGHGISRPSTNLH